MNCCDLHIHSTASDGTDRPDALPRLAKAAGLDAFALTDHDTADGVPACAAAAQRVGIDFVPGIELSVDPGELLSTQDDDGRPRRVGTTHVLGYFIRHDHPQLLAIRDAMRDARAQRNPQIIANLNRLGIDVDYNEVQAHAGDAVVGRPHIAAVMVRRGYVASVDEAFRQYIGEGRPAYARRDPLDAGDAIAAIHHAGGLACLAHPVQLKYRDVDHLKQVIRRLADAGLDGLECWHSDHTEEHRRNFQQLAAEFGLLVAGGSDYHGSRKAIALNACRVPYDVYEQLQSAASKRTASST